MNAWSAKLTEIRFDPPRAGRQRRARVRQRQAAGGLGRVAVRPGGGDHPLHRRRLGGRRRQPVPDDARQRLPPRSPSTGWSNGANWMMTLAEATIGIGVFNNNRATFDAGVRMWRDKVPTTIYMASDGALPMSPGSALRHGRRAEELLVQPDLLRHRAAGGDAPRHQPHGLRAWARCPTRAADRLHPGRRPLQGGAGADRGRLRAQRRLRQPVPRQGRLARRRAAAVDLGAQRAGRGRRLLRGRRARLPGRLGGRAGPLRQRRQGGDAEHHAPRRPPPPEPAALPHHVGDPHQRPHLRPTTSESDAPDRGASDVPTVRGPRRARRRRAGRPRSR